jgi:hypothetical protein
LIGKVSVAAAVALAVALAPTGWVIVAMGCSGPKG